MSNAGMLGMNPEEVNALAQQMTAAAADIEGLAQRITSALQSTTWNGNDRSQFESEWTGSCTTQIRTVCTALTEAADKARRNVQEQIQASS